MKLTIRTITVAVLITAFALPMAFSQKDKPGTRGRKPQSTPSKPDADIAAIRAESEKYVAAFNRRDAKAVAALWTDDGEYIDETGRRFSGRDEIEKGYAEIFAENPEIKVRIEIDSVRLLSRDTAIEDGRTIIDSLPDTAGISAYTVVHVKAGGQWRMASVRDTWVEPPAGSLSDAGLEWLVGSWVAEEHGVKTKSTVQWVADKHFLERRYTTTHFDGTTASGVQFIGWNPEGGHVQSWEFSPDGGHAVGLWTPTENGWRVDVQGTAGDGTYTAAVNVLKRLDDNAYAWQSVQRWLGDDALADTEEVVIKRNKKP